MHCHRILSPYSFLTAGVDDASIAPVGRGEGAAQAIGVGRHEDQVHVIGHQAPGPDRDGSAILGQEIAIEREVIIIEERPRAPIARCVT
jgi:hypothetical protein